jgi:hypothetical protein
VSGGAATASAGGRWRPQIMDRVVYGSLEWRVIEVWDRRDLGTVLTLEREVATVYEKRVVQGLTPILLAAVERLL